MTFWKHLLSLSQAEQSGLAFFFLSHMLKKNKIGGYEIQYDTVIDHDVFAFLRVSLEVPRGQAERVEVWLNGAHIGVIRVIKEGRKVRFAAARLTNGIEVPLTYFEPSKEIGKAAAAIISDFVK